MRLALYQPDIPQNTGTMLRMAACLGVAVDIVEPAGFDVSDRNFRRAGLDYLDALDDRRGTLPGAPSRRGAPSAACASCSPRRKRRRLIRTSPSARRHRPGRPRIRRRAGRGPCGGGRAGRRADAAGAALAQRRGRGGDDPRRGAAADRRFPAGAFAARAAGVIAGAGEPRLARDRARPPPAGRRADLVRVAARPHLRRARAARGRGRGAVRPGRDDAPAASRASPGSAPTTAARPAAAASWR